MSLDLFSIKMWSHRVNTNIHFILTMSTLPFYFLFSLSLLAHFLQRSLSAQHTKPSLSSWNWGIDKPKEIRWDRSLVLSGISEVQFSKGLWLGLQSHMWTTVFYDLLANLQLFHTNQSQKSALHHRLVAVMTVNSSRNHTTLYVIQASEKSQNSLMGLAI